MNQNDQYEEELGLSGNGIPRWEDTPLTEMEMYICSTETMDEHIAAIYQKHSNVNQRVKEINTLRRTGYVANSTYYSEIFEMSLKRTILPTLIANFKKLIAMNTNFFKNNDLKLVINENGTTVKTKSGSVFLEYPNFLPDQVLKHNGITEDNQVDYHFMAGFLLSAENFKIIQLGLTILAVDEKIIDMFK